MLKKLLQDKKNQVSKRFILKKKAQINSENSLKNCSRLMFLEVEKYESDFFCCQELSRGNSPIHSWSSTSSFISKLGNRAFISNVK